MTAGGSPTQGRELDDPLYASNGARPDVAHYDIEVEHRGMLSWRWEVVHWPDTFFGYNGRVYPSIDWRKSGSAFTREGARKDAESAIAAHKAERESRPERFTVAG